MLLGKGGRGGGRGVLGDVVCVCEKCGQGLCYVIQDDVMEVLKTGTYRGVRTVPDIGLICWMPFNVDWTAALRKIGCREYLLIGHAEKGLQGKQLDTWGVRPVCEEEGEEEAAGGEEEDEVLPLAQRPYVMDGYDRIAEEVHEQCSRFDNPVHLAMGGRSRSRVTIFKRQKRGNPSRG
eukprot:GHVS01042562.1.p1 GENE.GHVS01042562.1~~GHVS01042562.1.p1  ORF type:complete len:178 (+),score=36.77 GHVS01042562.1:174-707(+)